MPDDSKADPDVDTRTIKATAGMTTRDDSRLRVYAYFYYMAVGAGLNSDLAAVFVSSRLS